MESSQIGYYRVEKFGGNKHFAAKSREAILKYLGSPEDPMSRTSLFGYKLNTLEKITEAEARESQYFSAFAQRYGLCPPDGTWDLGMTGGPLD